MVHRLVVFVAIAAGLASAGPALSESASAPESPDALIVQAKDHAELQQKWCAANPNVSICCRIAFVDSELICDGGRTNLSSTTIR